ncbi:hypothetical protein JIN85_14820 [Luteolibacter pohnpeiensis]|uniref:Uncharacterized protein n=1 Tax=Luteolibacter pohnpeiensis TaxID=454153 RepID=A0A934VXC5_9BACT|nr:hypothetical protein [Luteolibacter pohnpeiensis]MBK1883688.1 hypothetical protein [Luteolibacter pohnpeiensis]
MAAVLLSVCILVIFLTLAQEGSLIDSNSRYKSPRLVALVVGILLCLAVLLPFIERVLGSPGVRFDPAIVAFRNGELVVSTDEADSRNVIIFYREWSWFKFKKEGEWRARPDSRGGWYYRDGAEWKNVPSEILENPEGGASRSYGLDNRGYYAQ